MRILSHPLNRYLIFVLAASVFLCACSTTPDKQAAAGVSEYSRSAEPARQLMLDGHMQEAIPVLQALSLEYPDLAAPYINLGIAYRNNGEADLARQAIDAAFEHSPENAPARHQSAILYREAGDFAAAEEDYLRAIEIEPDYALAYRNLGILYDLYMQRPDKALPYYQRYLQLEPEQSQEVSLWVADIELRLSATQARAAP